MRAPNDTTPDVTLEYDTIADVELRKMSALDFETIIEGEWHNAEEMEEWEFEDLVKDWSNAIKLNYYYGSQLGWNSRYDKINELLLPFSGMKNVSLAPEAFAQAVAAWQRSQGFSEDDCDGIIGPQTWGVMGPLLEKKSYVTFPVSPTIGGGTSVAPPTSDIFGFNNWHASKIVEAMSSGLLGTAFDSKGQLISIANGQQVKNVNPKTKIVASLPIIHHIMENARIENFSDIIIGSFIRDASNGSCTGHCAGRCIDINYKSGNFETSGAVKMVTNILRYLLSLPSQYKKSLGFGLPLQGQFFGKTNLKKFSSVSPSLLKDPDLRTLIPQLGIVFPDNDNHLHIQVNWVS
jgi:hypothetical protein